MTNKPLKTERLRRLTKTQTNKKKDSTRLDQTNKKKAKQKVKKTQKGRREIKQGCLTEEKD